MVKITESLRKLYMCISAVLSTIIVSWTYPLQNLFIYMQQANFTLVKDNIYKQKKTSKWTIMRLLVKNHIIEYLCNDLC